MKQLNYFFLIIILLIPGGLFSQSLVWGPEALAGGGAYGNLRPRIVLAKGNVPVIMWGGGTGSQPLYAARWNGTGFSTPVTLTPAGVDPFIDTWAGVSLAGSGDTLFVAFKRQPEMDNFIYTVRSTDGGMTWGDTVRVDGGYGPLTRMPSVGVKPGGNPMVVFMYHDSGWTNPRYVVINSSDGGQTYSPAVNASGVAAGEVCDCCQSSIFMEEGKQILTFRNNNNDLRDMWMSVSTDGGNTFQGIDIDNTDWYVSMCPSTGPEAMISGDSIITVWMNRINNSSRVYLSKTDPVTSVASPAFKLADNYSNSVVQNYPQIAGKGDTIGVVWEQRTINTDCYMSWSVTGADGLVNKESCIHEVATNNQLSPDIAYANGVFHVIYQNNDNGKVVYRKASISNVNGMEEAQNPDISIAPNPFKDRTEVHFRNALKEHARAELLTVTGKLIRVYPELNGNSLTIEKQGLASGIYLLRVISGDRVMTARIAVE